MDRRLQWIGRRQSHWRTILPVVIRHNNSSVAVMEVQCRISQRIRHATRTQTRPQATDQDYVIIRSIPNNESRDNEIGRSTDQPARAYVCQLRTIRGGYIVEFNQAGSRAAVISAQDRGVHSRIERSHNHRFQKISRCDSWRKQGSCGQQPRPPLAHQLSFIAINLPPPSRNSRNGSANTFGTPKLPNDGPRPRMAT